MKKARDFLKKVFIIGVFKIRKRRHTMNRIWLLIIIVAAAVLYFVFNKQNVKDVASEVEQKAETVINEVKEVTEEAKEEIKEDAKKIEEAVVEETTAENKTEEAK